MRRSLVLIFVLVLPLSPSSTAGGDDQSQSRTPTRQPRPESRTVEQKPIDRPDVEKTDQQAGEKGGDKTDEAANGRSDNSKKQTSDPEQAARIARWIVGLGDDNFAVREASSKKLVAAGAAAIAPLLTAAPNDDPEVTWRAVAALEALAVVRDDATARAAIAALHGLSNADHAAAAKRARHALDTVGVERRNLAIKQLTQRGAAVNVDRQTHAVTARMSKSWTGDVDDLVYLQDLVGLNWLSLEHSSLTDAALPHVAKCPGIENLYLGGSDIKGDNLDALQSLSKLEYLSLMNLAGVGDEQLKKLTAANTVQHLGLDGTSVTNAGLAHLKHFKNLKRLWLDDTKVTPAGLKHLKPLTDLETLNLLRLDMTGSGLKHLKAQPNLRQISLQGATLDAAALTELATLDQLRSLALNDAKGVDAAAIKRLKQALPQCEIEH